MKLLHLFPAIVLLAWATTTTAQLQPGNPLDGQEKLKDSEAMRASSADIISDHPELMLTSTQGWGELGVNAAAHLPNQPALPLQIADKRFAKGLGSHAPGEIVLLLDQQYSRFESEIGVQKQPGDCGSVVFKVFADGKEVFESGRMDGRTPAQAMSIPVDGIEELRLVATDAGDGIFCDLANWADARLIPAANATGTHPATTRVDMAPFARVATWDPARMDGARASRIQEFRAEDLFTETELKPDRDGSYVVPVWTNGVGCIGLQWLTRRALRELVLEFVDSSQIPAADSIRVEGWFGESAWQGNWKPLTNEWRREDRRLICRLAPRAGMVQTRKIRWILSPATKPHWVRLSAFTRSSWGTTNLFVQIENPGIGSRGELTIWNGEPVNRSSLEWRTRQPILTNETEIRNPMASIAAPQLERSLQPPVAPQVRPDRAAIPAAHRRRRRCG